MCWYLQVAWYLKCRAITLKSWIDDTDIEEEVSQRTRQHVLPAGQLSCLPAGVVWVQPVYTVMQVLDCIHPLLIT